MKQLLSVLFLFVCFKLFATDYYVSQSAGSDANDGLTPATAWQTLAKVETEAANLVAGDNVYFNRGDTWNEGLALSNVNGITANYIGFGAYGYGENPTFDGTIDVSSGWTAYNDTIYVVNIPGYPASTEMTGVIYDTSYVAMSRYPNPDAAAPFLTNDYLHEFTDRQRLRDDDLPGILTANGWTDGQFTGAMVGFRTREFIFDVREVTSHTGIQINLDANLVYGAEIDYGYIFMNDSVLIDQDTEWYWDKVNNDLYMQLYETPNNHTILIPNIDKLLDIDNCDYISIHDITFKGAKATAVEITNAEHINFYRNKILLSGKNALFVNTSKYLQIYHDTIRHTQNNAMEINADIANIHDNYIYQTAMLIGMGASGNGQYLSSKITGANGNYKYNHVINSGYNAIHWGEGPWTIRYNYVDGFCAAKRDGGGIYTFDTEDTRPLTRITDNIVLNGLGDQVKGVPDDHYYGTDMGLYSDGGTAHVTWKDNVVGFAGTGIFNHIGSYEDIENNLVVGSRTSSIRFTYDLGGTNPESSGNIIKHNIMVHGNDQYAVFPVWGEITDASTFGDFDFNTHIVPLSSINIQSPWMTMYEASNASDQRHYNQRNIVNAPYWNNDTLSSYHNKRFTVTAVGANITVNANMDNAPDNNNGLGSTGSDSPSFTVTKINTGDGVINGNTFQCRFNSPSAGDFGELIHKNLNLDRDTWYRLKISLKGSSPTFIVLRIRTNSTPPVLHHAWPLNIEDTLNNYEIVFKPRESHADVRTHFDFTNTADTVWVDDFFIEPITTKTEETYGEFVNLEVNPSKTVKSYTLAGSWKDIYHNTVTFPRNINPYKGEVLLKVIP